MGEAREAVAEPLNGEVVKLTTHQTAILQWIANGKKNEEIALLMNLERPQTVQAHVQRIMDKTGTATRAGAVAWALRHGLIT